MKLEPDAVMNLSCENTAAGVDGQGQALLEI